MKPGLGGYPNLTLMYTSLGVQYQLFVFILIRDSDRIFRCLVCIGVFCVGMGEQKKGNPAELIIVVLLQCTQLAAIRKFSLSFLYSLLQNV